MHDLSTTAAAILAGGRARRYGGRDKCRLVIEGHTIIVRQLAVLQRLARHIMVIGGPPARFTDLPVEVYADIVPDAGPLGGLHAALTHARADTVIVVGCDLPFLDTALLAALVARAGQADGAWIRTSRGPEPLLACYRRSAVPHVRSLIDAGRFRLADLAHVLDIREIGPDELAAFGDPDRLLANLNAPGDYARVQYRRS